MTRALDQADVDAVVEALYPSVTGIFRETEQMSDLRTRVTDILNAAVALGWTPPARPGDAFLAIRLTGLDPHEIGDWRLHPLVDHIIDTAHDEADKYNGVTVDVEGMRSLGGSDV